MLVSAAIPRINYLLRGTDDDAPAVGTSDYTYWLDTLNRKKDELYADITQQWRNSYDVLAVGTTTAGTAVSLDLDDTFLAPSDSVYVIDRGGLRHDYFIVQPQERDVTKQQVFIGGHNPQTLYFTKPILSTDQIVGGTVYMPGYYLPPNVNAATDTLPVPDPNWQCIATAAELAFSDSTYENKAPDLQTKANSLYDLMVKANRRGTYGNARKMPVILPTGMRNGRYR